MTSQLKKLSLAPLILSSAIILSGCGLFGKKGGGGGGTTPTTPSTSTNGQAAGDEGMGMQADYITLVSLVDVDPGVTMNAQTSRKSPSAVVYPGETYNPSNPAWMQGVVTGSTFDTTENFGYHRSVFTLTYIAADGSRYTKQQLADQTSTVNAAALDPKIQAVLDKPWKAEYKVTQGQGLGGTFTVNATFTRLTQYNNAKFSLNSYQGAQEQREKVTISLQNDVTADERNILSQYFNLADPTSNYLTSSDVNRERTGVNPADVWYVNGKDMRKDFAIIWQRNGSIVDETRSGNHTLADYGSGLVIKYPNRLVAVVFPGGYASIQNNYDGTALTASKANYSSTSTYGSQFNDTYSTYAFVPTLALIADSATDYPNASLFSNGSSDINLRYAYAYSATTDAQRQAMYAMLLASVKPATLQLASQDTNTINGATMSYNDTAAALSPTALVRSGKFIWVGPSLGNGTYATSIGLNGASTSMFSTNSTMIRNGTSSSASLSDYARYTTGGLGYEFGINSTDFNQNLTQSATNASNRLFNASATDYTSYNRLTLDMSTATYIPDAEAATEKTWNKLDTASATIDIWNSGVISGKVSGVVYKLDHVAIYNDTAPGQPDNVGKTSWGYTTPAKN